jgi:DNA-binding transcriptional LysR family regulator
MFLLAVEEMSFSKAAERAFVTQQCLSHHIKHLETLYQVPLFYRKPKLALTPEGVAMVKYLTRIQVLEDSMKKELSDINTGIKGKINFGIGSTRGSILVHHVVQKFREIAPNVDLQVTLGDTQYLEQLLLNGKLDLFLGVTATQNVIFKRLSLARESLYLIIPECMVKRRFPDKTETVMHHLKKGVDLRQFPGLPFVMGHEYSRTTLGINQYHVKYNLDYHVPIFISDFSIHLKLCRTGSYATVTPFSHLNQLIKEEQYHYHGEKLCVFPLLNIDQKYQIELIQHRDAPPLKMFDDFALTVKSQFDNCFREVTEYLEDNGIAII